MKFINHYNFMDKHIDGVNVDYNKRRDNTNDIKKKDN